MQIAFIGLGRMGTAIAKCILRANFQLSVWNRTTEKMQALVDCGARAAGSAKELAADADVIVTCLMDDQSVLDVLHGPTGVLAGMAKSAVHICLTTISPNCADELEQIHQEHGTQFIAGPVSGRPDAAATGSLLTYIAGPPAAIELVKPVCAAYAKQIVIVPGRPRIANCVKLAINFSACSIMEMLGEAYTFAEKCGVSLDLLNDWYDMAFTHPALKTYAHKIRHREFNSAIAYSMKGGLKDVELMISTAEQVGADLELARIVRKKTQRALELGMVESDWTGFTEITRYEIGLS